MAITLAGYLASTPARIWLKGYQMHYLEFPCGTTLLPSPGHLIEVISDGTVRKCQTYGKKVPLMFAVEDALQGLSISDAYAASTICRAQVAEPGNELQARLAANAPAVLVGDMLVSAGDGTLVKSPVNAGNLLFANTAASTALTGSSTETLFDKNYTLPANFLQAGDVLTVKGQVVATATNSTDTLTVKLYIGGLAGTAILSTGALDVANSDIAVFEANLIVRTVGASGTFVAAGWFNIGTGGTATNKSFFLASTAIDTTTSKVIGASGTWSTTNGGNSCRLDELTVQLSRGQDFARLAMALTAVDNSAGSSEAFIPVLAV